MKNFLTLTLMVAINLKLCLSLDTPLVSKDFQKDFLQEMSAVMKNSALEVLNKYLKNIQRPAYVNGIFDEALDLALKSKKLETKVVFLKQWFDMSEQQNGNRENLYGLRNVHFLKKLKDKLYVLQEESFEEMHNLRYYYLCQQFNMSSSQERQEEQKHHHLYSEDIKLAPINEQNVAEILQKLGLKDNHTISISVKDFGQQLYSKVNNTGAELINDYLWVIRKLLQEVLEAKEEGEEVEGGKLAVKHNEALEKVLQEIDMLLNTTDFYSKRQRLYDYLQNNLAMDFEEFQNTENSQQDLVGIFEKLKAKGLDLIVAFLFSNVEFADHVHQQWAAMLPKAPLTLFEEKNGSRQLAEIQQLYESFKEDFENASKYDAYLEAVKLLHEQTQSSKADTTHIYEMLYSASQNVGSTRVVLMNEKCKEV
ncbi:uncharacterized protein LOC106094113 [Stomoxys calcitrans]|uniref:uncharacterized protein LOC106094113 n=1 Tax=Stomoxys calcitrans TaxID=35570 RepID=UPI0027E27BCF|nr:uncharacterized protein LOC106094113 [Stomoxys calcitrans]